MRTADCSGIRRLSVSIGGALSARLWSTRFCHLGGLDLDFGTPRTPMSAGLPPGAACIEKEFPDHSDPVTCQQVECDFS